MFDLTLQGENYSATFQDVERKRYVDDEDGVDIASGNHNCWTRGGNEMSWTGSIMITNNSTKEDVRAYFETLRRRDVEGGIRDETLEESLLMVRGFDQNGRYVTHKCGQGVVTNRVGLIDYLLEIVHEDIVSLRDEEIFPTVKIPLLEQSTLYAKGYASEEPVLVS